jgi:glycerophosphoryl diester phosphodiesterase
VLLEKIIGHRGAAAHAPENTLASFDQAFYMGCRFIEFDVMLSADGVPFVFHDEVLKRTTNGKGAFGQMTAEYIQSLDAGRWFSKRFSGEKIPTLRAALEWLTFHDVQANIEIKPYPGTTEQTVIAVLTHLNQFWPFQEALPLVSSFDVDALNLVKSIAPEIPLGLLLDRWDKDWLKTAHSLRCYSVHLNHKALTEERILEIKQHDYKVCAYTVNRRRLADKLFTWGVDAVFSDNPGLLE